MDNWKNRPPQPNEFGGIRLIRVPKGKTLDLLVTSDLLVGCDTHFTRRRTSPCTGPACDLCLDGGQPRWHGYISVCSLRLTTSAVLEITALAAAPVIDYQDRHGSLRGAKLRAYRSGNHDNSPVVCQLEPSDSDLRTLPPGVHLENFLDVLWRSDATGNGHAAPDTTLDTTPDDS